MTYKRYAKEFRVEAVCQPSKAHYVVYCSCEVWGALIEVKCRFFGSVLKKMHLLDVFHH